MPGARFSLSDSPSPNFLVPIRFPCNRSRPLAVLRLQFHFGLVDLVVRDTLTQLPGFRVGVAGGGGGLAEDSPPCDRRERELAGRNDTETSRPEVGERRTHERYRWSTREAETRMMLRRSIGERRETSVPVPGSYEFPNCFVIVRPSPRGARPGDVVRYTFCSSPSRDPEARRSRVPTSTTRNGPVNRNVVVLVFIVKRRTCNADEEDEQDGCAREFPRLPDRWWTR